ncbi:N-acyl-D-amino-acid deacylase family protein [Hyphococcus sp.]|uniref:N-acyl-D-amino-acid deacylase family protein n=1 Tax=Hyphococcus sp. TaxID=2038636 RepID=UPI003CCBE641
MMTSRAGALILIISIAIFSLVVGAEAQTAANSGNRADIVIRGGKIIDGTGARPFIGDVAVAQDRIIFVGERYAGQGLRELDAEGLVVAPGFIDAHSHADRDVGKPGRGANEGYVRQGVTTFVGGPDGGASPGDIQSYLSAYEENGVSTNYAFYVGHNAIRREVMGPAPREAREDELHRMGALVKQGMEMGAVGFSTGLMYEPGMWSSTEEIIALAKEVAPFGGVYDSHVRNPVFDLLGSDREAIEIGRAAGIPVKIGHLKVVGLHNAGLIDDVIDLINKARSEGVLVVADQYPYDGAATKNLHEIVLLPEEVEEKFNQRVEADGNEAQQGARLDFIKEALSDRSTREAARRLSEQGREGGFSWIRSVGYTSIRIVQSHEAPDIEGAHLSELSDQDGKSGFDTLVDVITKSEHPTLATMGSVASGDVETLLVQPWTMIASDGAWLAEQENAHGGHPRSTGTFPKVLGQFVREQGVLDLAEAVRKMTDFPADFLQLDDRGRLQNGYFADIVIFSEEEIAARSNWENSTLYAAGVRDVIVNGEFVLQNKQMTNRRPGRHLRKGSRPRSGE